MGRSKQPPIKRETSSEYFNKRTATWEEGEEKRDVAGGETNGDASSAGRREEREEPERAQAGVAQVVIAVAGIYASL